MGIPPIKGKVTNAMVKEALARHRAKVKRDQAALETRGRIRELNERRLRKFSAGQMLK